MPSVRSAARPSSGGWADAIVFAGASSAVVLALYLVLPWMAGYIFPIGPDGPVYTWWTQGAGVLGLDAVAPGRPGVPAAALVLGGALGTTPLQTVTSLGPVLVAACALAAAAFLDVALPPSRVRAVAAALLTAGFAAYLAGGWLANLAQVTVFLAALAAVGTSHASWRGVAAAVALIAAAALAHGLFAAVALAILAGAAAWNLPAALAHRRNGGSLLDTLAARMAAATTGGALLGAGALAAVGTAGLVPGHTSHAGVVPGDTSQDGFFRRLGLRQLLADRYRERLAGDAARAAAPLAAGAGLAAAAAPVLRSRSGAAPPRSYLVGLLVSWAAITVVGLVVLWATASGPPNRMLVFAFFVPLAAAAGVDALARPASTGARASRAARTGRRALAAAAAITFVAVAMLGWYRQAPSFAPEELAAARRAGAVVERLPPGRPVVILVDTDQRAAAFHVTRFANVLRMGLPPERLPDVRIAVGVPGRYLAGRPTLTGDREHDLIARAYLRESRAVRRDAVVLVVRAFNAGGFGVTSGARTAAAGVEVVQGPDVAPAPAAVRSPEGLSFGALMALSAASLVLLAAFGLGWARWALAAAALRAVASVAPAVGLAVAILGG
ncbi:MAG TPA: hypothetical protein VHL78_10950, partial [Actinomycetota bacterium]|nr:hypothetical protein [Actinomycetota bacterium]